MSSGEIAREDAPGNACDNSGERNIRLALVLVERIEVGANGCPIATCDGPGQRSCRSTFCDIGECCLHHSPEAGWVDVQPTRKRFDFATERNKVICRDRRSCVIRRTIIVGDTERDAPEQGYHRRAGGVSRNGESAAIEQACCADHRIGQ
jgi:hypothetical protein